MKPQAKKQNRIQRTDKKVEESLSYTVEVTDKEGRVLERISAPSRSYAQPWNQIINAHALPDYPKVRDTLGIDRIGSRYDQNLSVDADIGVVNYGIRVGKGTTAVAITDYALESPCGEGTGTDEFNHQVVKFTTPSVAGSTCSFTIKRNMVNNSGAPITVGEIGCYYWFYQDRYAMGFRDVLPGAISIPDGGAITVTYTLKVTV